MRNPKNPKGTCKNTKAVILVGTHPINKITKLKIIFCN